jgi:hypothetical protein
MARLQRRRDEDDVDLVALRHQVDGWWGVKYQSKVIAKKLNAGKTTLLKMAQRYGQPDPETGSLFLDLEEPVSDRRIVRLKAQRAETMGINPEACEKILKEKGLWDEMVEWVPQLDEGKVHAAYFDKKITDDELSRMMPRSVHYSLILLDEDGKPVN